MDLIGTYKIRKEVHDDPLVLKALNMIDPETGWFEKSQYNDKQEYKISNMVKKTWFFRSVYWSGIHGPIAYSLLSGGIPIPEQRLCGTLDSVPFFSLLFSRQTMVLVPPPPLSPLQDSPGFLAQCSSPVSSIFSSYCLLSVRVCSFGRPPPAASGHSASVRQMFTTLRLTADQCPLLVSCPVSRMKV